MDGALSGVAERRLTEVLATRLTQEPVVVLTGPRTVGKSTLLTDLSQRLRRPIIDCDRPDTLSAVRNDPMRFVSGPAPVLIDEYQRVPELLDAIKAELNRRLDPGRFVLAGSTHYGALPQAGQALTGRVDVLPVLPLSQGEIDRSQETFMTRLLDDDPIAPRQSGVPTGRVEYARRITSGGMPVPLLRPAGKGRSRWFANYANLVIERDVLDLSRVRQREMLPRLLNQLAARSGQVLNIASVGSALGMEKSTTENYVKLLEAVFLVHRLSAWGVTLTARVNRHPKLYVVDSGVMASLLGLTVAKIESGDPAVLSEYGHLVEAFVVGEILKQISWWDGPVTTGHFRTANGDEVDLIVERDDGQVFAFEVKAGSRVHGEDLRGLRLLRDRLGRRLQTAVVFYSGEHEYRVDDQIEVLPMDRLWR